MQTLPGQLAAGTGRRETRGTEQSLGDVFITFIPLLRYCISQYSVYFRHLPDNRLLGASEPGEACASGAAPCVVPRCDFPRLAVLAPSPARDTRERLLCQQSCHWPMVSEISAGNAAAVPRRTKMLRL